RQARTPDCGHAGRVCRGTYGELADFIDHEPEPRSGFFFWPKDWLEVAKYVAVLSLPRGTSAARCGTVFCRHLSAGACRGLVYGTSRGAAATSLRGLRG